ncbi:MAG TPA: hypothetical protein VFA89_08810 [Terriglobales bacterium]|nr:hypothetical protein [Terriglobales bacterium]
MTVNRARVWLGAVAGAVVWFFWSFIAGQVIIGNARYQAAMDAGMFLKQPRYSFFVGQWFVILLIVSVILAHLYAWARPTLGPGPKTAFKIGALVGFSAGFPDNFAFAAWSPLSRMFPLGWMLDMWVGAILATLTAGFIYRQADEKRGAAGAGF